MQFPHSGYETGPSTIETSDSSSEESKSRKYFDFSTNNLNAQKYDFYKHQFLYHKDRIKKTIKLEPVQVLKT